VTPALTSQAQERPRDSDVEGRRCRGGARMPGRGRPDGVAAAASRLAGGGSRERRRALRRPSRPNQSCISSSWKSLGSGLQFSSWWAAKGRTNLAQVRLARGRQAQENGRDPHGKLGCQRSPYRRVFSMDHLCSYYSSMLCQHS